MAPAPCLQGREPAIATNERRIATTTQPNHTNPPRPMGKAQRLRTAPPVGNAGYVDPEPAGPSTIYLPNLIVALVASVGIVVGSLGPWVTLLMFDRNATDGDGKYTLVLGIIAAAMLFVVLNLGQSWTKTALMRRLTILAALSGGLSFAIGVIDAHEVLSRKVELFGTTIGAQIGWGLWLTLIASLALVVTAVVVAKQLPSEDES